MTIIKHISPSKGQYRCIENGLVEMDRTFARPQIANRQIQYQKCKRLITMALVFTLGFAICAYFTSIVYPPSKTIHILYLKANKPPVHVTNKKFLSVGLDSSVIAEGFKHFDMNNVKLKNMINNLRPGYLRVGGTLADRLEFDKNGKDPLKVNYLGFQDGGVCSYEYFNCKAILPNFTFSGEEWLKLYDLGHTTGFEIIFDLNVLTRYNNTWNHTNAKEMIDFSRENNMNVSWELGNEPNSFKHVFNYTVDASQLAGDYKILKELIEDDYKNSFIVGPSVTHPRPENPESMEYLREFLLNGGNEAVNAITWHQYYFNGRTATSDQFLNIDIFNTLAAEISMIKGIVSSVNSHQPIWLGETAAAYGGGAPGYNNRYIGTFIWLDKLGLAAKMGLDVVVRQSIFKGYYGLIYGNDYQPTPDYWIALLYKRLVGPEVLPCHSITPHEVRLYCHCTNRAYDVFPAVTVFGMNMKNTEAIIRFEGFTVPYYTTSTVFAFILTSHGTLLSKDIDLNSKMLELNDDGTPPRLIPLILRHEDHVIMPPYSTAFFVIPTQGLLEGCKSSPI